MDLKKGSASSRDQRIIKYHGNALHQWPRVVINCMCLWQLGSASGVTGRVMDADGRNRLGPVINCIRLWNLASASGRDRRIVGFMAELN